MPGDCCSLWNMRSWKMSLHGNSLHKNMKSIKINGFHPNDARDEVEWGRIINIRSTSLLTGNNGDARRKSWIVNTARISTTVSWMNSVSSSINCEDERSGDVNSDFHCARGQNVFSHCFFIKNYFRAIYVLAASLNGVLWCLQFVSKNKFFTSYREIYGFTVS